MAGEMNWVYVLGLGTIGTMFLFFLGNRVPVRQKYQKGTRK
jgi:hypothetical protein